ncbi:MAG TPA: HAMP domain-containing protein [Candidatus Coprocola pullicola]|nr:HAMP domain-containing protein [Candidatus Coprocola pullicola]
MQKKLFLSYVAMILFIAFLIGFYSIKMNQNYYTQQYKTHLLKEGYIAAKNLKDTYDKENFLGLDAFGKELSKYLELRVTIIDASGNVLSDSEGKAYGVNHKNREEVQAALEGKSIVVNRKSETTGVEYMYTAIPVTLDTKTILLRFSVPMTQLDGIRKEMVIYVSFSTIISIIVAFFCAYYLSKKISEPLDDLTNAAVEVSQGKYDKKIPVATNDQIGSLTKTFNKMSVKLNTTIHALETENKKMEAIVNSMINGVVAIDKKNKILMMNDQCYKLFDIKFHYCTGLDFYDIFRNEDIYALLETSIAEKRNVVDIVTLKSHFNGDKILRVYVTQISCSNEKNDSLGTLLVFQDVTQIKKLEKMRSDFISNVTHELKTPLTSIMGFTDTLRSGAIHDSDAAEHFLEIIDIETHRLYRLIQDILSLSEIETRKEDTNRQYESIENILQYVEGLLRPQAEEKGLQLNMNIEPIPPYFCNRDKISQMFINLIENAIKYTEKGSITVSCKNQGDCFLFQVKDTGIGIPQESIERIFERFYRVDKGRSRKAGGTGLGLSIVKHIMLLYGGKVSVESKEGEGTTFTITMPYET